MLTYSVGLLPNFPYRKIQLTANSNTCAASFHQKTLSVPRLHIIDRNNQTHHPPDLRFKIDGLCRVCSQ